MNDTEQKMEQLIGSAIPFKKSEEDKSPVYAQLAGAIRRQIEKNHLPAGMLLPSERQVASFGHISIATVRKAFEELAAVGYIHRVQGKGTYVSSTADRRKKVRYYPLVEGFYSEQVQGGIGLVALKIMNGTPGINKQLQIRSNQKLYELRRVITSGQKPIVYCISYLPQKMFKGLEDAVHEDLDQYSLYVFLEEKFGVPTIRHIELFSAECADQDVARCLHVKPGHPLVKIEKLIFTHRDNPYEYRVSFCLTDTYRLRRII